MTDKYKNAGVDLKAGEEIVKRIKDFASATFNENVLSGIGHFGAFYKADFGKMKEPVLVSSVDGVGTKLKIAIALNKHDTIGQDLVNHCVNDISVGGAQPLFFLDYLAFGKLNVETAAEIIKGFSKACRKNGLALIGGETAEMPGVYAENEYDISGTIVGVADKEKIINGDLVEEGDVLIGIASNGLHTNGYSLARSVLLKQYSLTEFIPELNSTLGNELLRVHKSYLNFIQKLSSEISVHAFSHITGGGILGNTRRVVPDKLKINVDWNAWETPPIFNLIQEAGGITDEEMRQVFNLGVGLIAIVGKKDVEQTLKIAGKAGEKAFVIGKISGA